MEMGDYPCINLYIKASVLSEFDYPQQQWSQVGGVRDCIGRYNQMNIKPADIVQLHLGEMVAIKHGGKPASQLKCS